MQSDDRGRNQSSGIGSFLRGYGGVAVADALAPYAEQGVPNIMKRNYSSLKRAAITTPSLLERVAAKRMRGLGGLDADDSFGIVNRANPIIKKRRQRQQKRVATPADTQLKRVKKQKSTKKKSLSVKGKLKASAKRQRTSVTKSKSTKRVGKKEKHTAKRRQTKSKLTKKVGRKITSKKWNFLDK